MGPFNSIQGKLQLVILIGGRFLRLQVGCSEIVGRIVEDLKDENEPYRRMVMETIDKVVRDLGTADIDARLEELLIDGILYAFQEQVR